MAAQAPETKEAEAKSKREKKSNCPACNKIVKRLKRYYRDGKFYCSKKCWRAFITESKPQGNGLASNSQSHKPEGNGLPSVRQSQKEEEKK